jgi:hypothetical protein
MTAEEMKERAAKLLSVVGLDKRYPDITITGSAQNLCDPSIDIEGVSISIVDMDVPTIGGTRTVAGYQVSTVEYIPAMRGPNGDPGDPPDEDIKDHGEPHRMFEDAMVQAIKLLVENDLLNFLDVEQEEGE